MQHLTKLYCIWPLFMKSAYFCKRALENIGNSFVVGVGTRLLYKYTCIGSNNKSRIFPDLYTLVECARAGCNMAKYTFLHSITYYTLNCIGFDGFVLSMLSVYATSFYFGLKKGAKSAANSALLAICSTYVKALINL